MIELQEIYDSQADIVIYNSFRPSEESEYLPVLNVCSEAFTWSIVNSVTFKDRHTDDETAPVFNHKINIRSNAFLYLEAYEVKFEVGVTFEHPADFQNAYYSDYDGSEIIGDANNKSVKIFAESTIVSVTLPQDIDLMPEKMFYNCPYLKEIKYFERKDLTNTITDSVVRIGTSAFHNCVALPKLVIPNTVVEIGDVVFNNWGTKDNIQTLYIDFYDGYLPNGWSSNWDDGMGNNMVINYKEPTAITLDYDDNETTKTIYVLPSLFMPDIEKPERAGYIFKGIFSDKKGLGFQYYTDTMEVNRLWQDGDSATLYANWQVIEYEIIYHKDLAGLYNPNVQKYTIEDEVVLDPLEDDAYIYTLVPNVIEKGTTGTQNIFYSKKPKYFNIEYVVDDYKGNTNPNPTEYDVNDEIVFTNLVCEGYTFSWSPAGIAKGSTGELTVRGTWTANEYDIIYKVRSDITVVEPLSYTYGVSLNLNPIVRGGYFVTWDTKVIPKGTIGEVTVTAVGYTEKTLDECYYEGVYEIWTLSQFLQLRNQPNYGEGRTYKLMASHQVGQEHIRYEFTPLDEFRGTLDGNGFKIYNYSLITDSGSDIGFCRINRGTIKNLLLGFSFDVSSSRSNVNVGSFAGINYGTISNCSTGLAPTSYRCYAGGTSYAGLIVGVNEGVIENCSGVGWLLGNCNMGTVAGKNVKTIRDCNMGNGNTKIEYKYYDGINPCIGGIVGLQTAGSVSNCNFHGNILWENLNVYENRTVQPCGGTIIGRKQGGTVSGCDSRSANGGGSTVVGTLADYHIVTWKSGSTTYTHDQWLYFKNEECGRIG